MVAGKLGSIPLKRNNKYFQLNCPRDWGRGSLEVKTSRSCSSCQDGRREKKPVEDGEGGGEDRQEAGRGGGEREQEGGEGGGGEVGERGEGEYKTARF